MNANNHARPRVAMVNRTKNSHPSRKFRTPKMAATRTALPRLLTWNPGNGGGQPDGQGEDEPGKEDTHGETPGVRFTDRPMIPGERPR
jgi:hypothetical protein